MSFRELRDDNIIFHLVETNSEEAKAYVKRLMRDICEAETADISIATKPDTLQTMINNFSIPPFLTSEWLGEVEYSRKMDRVFEANKKQMIEGYGKYLIFVDNYGDYKRIKQILPDEVTNVLYLGNLKYGEILFILGKDATRLSDKIIKDIYRNYNKNIDAILKLSSALKDGEVINSKKDLEDLCGQPDPDIAKMVLALAQWVYKSQEKFDGITYDEWLKSITKTAKVRLKPILNLMSLKSPQYVRVVIENTLFNFLAIKDLYTRCLIYRPEDLDEYDDTSYDMTALRRLKKHYNAILGIPAEVYMSIYEKISRTPYWYSDVDAMIAIYSIFCESVV